MRKLNSKGLTIRMVDGTTVKGKINIGNARRISDYVNRGENLFVVVFDAEVEGSEGEVIFVNRNHIVWARPDEKMLPPFDDEDIPEITMK